MPYDKEDCERCYGLQAVCDFHRGFALGWDACAEFTKSAQEKATISDRVAAFTRRAAQDIAGSDIPAHLLDRSRRRRKALEGIIDRRVS